MWLTDEYATSFFRSFCAIAQNAPYKMLINPNAATAHAAHCVASGSIGKLMRIMPYVPILSSTPARMTEIAVGASTCASGNQVWKGNIGTLMAKPMNSAIHTMCWKFMPRIVGALAKLFAYVSLMMSNVCLAGVPSTRYVGAVL